MIFGMSLDMISSPATPDSLRKKLEEVFKLMLVVWAKEGIALRTLSGEKSGNSFIVLLYFDKNKTNKT